MATPLGPALVGPETPISIRVTVQGISKKFKLPLADLVPQILPGKLHAFLGIPDNRTVTFERFSDSSASFVNLDPTDVHAYKTLYRAAKAKLKLRLRATLGPDPNIPTSTTQADGANANQMPYELTEAAKALEDAFNSMTNLRLGSETTLTNVSAVDTVKAATPSSEPVKNEAASTYLPSTRFVPHPINPEKLSSQMEKLIAPPGSSSAWSSEKYRSTWEGLVTLPGTSNYDWTKKPDEPTRKLPNAFEGHEASGNNAIPPPMPSAKPKRVYNYNRPCLNMPYDPVRAQRKCPAFTRLASITHPDLTLGLYSVYCNACDKRMDGEHYHCNICENGDYDLCTSCMSQGVHCPGEDHWLIKRSIKDDEVINSTTETVLPKGKETVTMPGAFTEEKKTEEEVVGEPTRTCNCCLKVFSEHDIVNCAVCDDYDLCRPCLVANKHGHHPGHAFVFVHFDDRLKASERVVTMCTPGRGVRHAAVCDACNSTIVGVRHKCQICPDWDYCGECVVAAKLTHPRHRFAAIYDPMPYPAPENCQTHTNIYCDGPLCNGKSRYISGVRYKCAVCPDVDFCENCEASPQFGHNRTHPLLKFQTPVRGCSITTMVGNHTINSPTPCGACDTGLAPPQAVSVSSTTPYELSKIRTVADVKPTEPSTNSLKEKIEIKDLLSEPIQETIKVKDLLSSSIEETKVDVDVNVNPEPKVTFNSTDLQAHFIRDTVPDGSVLMPTQRFVQVWTLRNPGPYAWPIGCSVRYVGGDNMLNVDDAHPSSAADITKATESNVIERAVEVGEQIEFRVVMKAPKREGVAISYWRLKAADGTPFGHRLWCHINVLSNAPGSLSQRSQESVPEGRDRAFLKLFLDEADENARKMKEENAAKFEGLRTVYDQTKDRMQKIDRDEKTKRLKQLLDDRAVIFQDQLKCLQEKSDAMSKKHESLREKGESPQSDEAVRRANRVSTLAELLGRRQRLRLAIRNPNVDEVPEASSTNADVPLVKNEEEVQSQDTAKIEVSAMVFPTLEKESPAASTHEDHIPTNGATSENVPAVASAEDPEFFEDAESVSLVDDSDASEDFLTDEEYDILDASDEELA